jgi:glycerol uptake facilitator-like aquaporin
MGQTQLYLFVSGLASLKAADAHREEVNRLKAAVYCTKGWRFAPERVRNRTQRNWSWPSLLRKNQLNRNTGSRPVAMELDARFTREEEIREEEHDGTQLRRRFGFDLGGFQRLTRSSLPPWHCLFAELLGTSLLTLFSCLIGLSNSAAVPFLAGAMVSCLVLAFIPTSGALLNPFVVLALFVTKRLDLASSLAYSGTQLIGGFLGATVFAALATPSMYDRVAGGTVSIQTDLSLWQGAGWEFFLTFSLISLISSMGFAPFELSSETDPNRWLRQAVFALLIGLLVGLLVGVGGPVTGCSMNAARASGPLLVAQLRAWTTSVRPSWLDRALHGHFVIYWLAPAFGSLAGALVMEHALVSPWLQRSPRSILSDLGTYTQAHLAELRSYGSAGLIAYGILNTILYGSVFTYSFLFVFASQPGAVAKAWAASWIASQATKPVRVFIAVAMAPVIRRFLTRLPWNRH